jgi:type IV secretion system protein VirB4
LRKQGELLEAEDGDDSYSRAHLIVAALGNTAEAARDTAMALDASLSQASVLPVWESAGALDAYLALQPGAKPYEPRALMLNSFQTAATGLHYKIHQGATRVEEVGGDEPVMVLETKDGQPYGFSPWVGEKATIIGIGPPGSGKTFFQNLTGAHWGKYRGLFVTADFDHGGEVVPRLYGQDGAIFDGAAGMNPFRAQGPVPGEFRAHMTRLCMAMLRANDDPAMQSLAAGEQAHIDRAIAQTVALPPHLQTLSNFVHHLPQELMAKFSRWVSTGEGRYSAYLDAEDDRVGRLDRLATAFNLTRIRDDDAARGPIVLELLWRVTTAFEDLSRLREPKKLKLDEARLALRDPIIGPYIAEKAVTWRKFKASLELWSQDPEHFATATHWDAIRGSASMFVFTAAPDLNADSYRSVFGLTATDVDTIRTLTPKREIYLVQAETGVRKRLIVDADADARRWASSTADQVAASLASTPALRVIEGGHRHAS